MCALPLLGLTAGLSVGLVLKDEGTATESEVPFDFQDGGVEAFNMIIENEPCGACVKSFREQYELAKELFKQRDLARFMVSSLLLMEVARLIRQLSFAFAITAGLVKYTEVAPILLSRWCAIMFAWFWGEVIRRPDAAHACMKVIASMTLLATVLFWYMETSSYFWSLGILLACCSSGEGVFVQNVLSEVTPAYMFNETYDIAITLGQILGFLGPFIFSSVSHLTGSMEAGFHFLVMLSVAAVILMWSVDLNRATHTAEHAYNSLSTQQSNEDDLPAESLHSGDSPIKGNSPAKVRGLDEFGAASSPWDLTPGSFAHPMDMTPASASYTSPGTLKESEWLPPDEWTPAPQVRNQRSDRGESMQVTPALMQVDESLLSVMAPSMQDAIELSQTWREESNRDKQKRQLQIMAGKWQVAQESIQMETLRSEPSPTPTYNFEDDGMTSIRLNSDSPNKLQNVTLDITRDMLTDDISPQRPRRIPFDTPQK